MNSVARDIAVGRRSREDEAREREGRLIGDVFSWDYRIRDPHAERAFRVSRRRPSIATSVVTIP